MNNNNSILVKRLISFSRKAKKLSTATLFRISLVCALFGSAVTVAMQDTPDTVPMQTQASGCSLRIERQEVHIEPGQGIESNGRWAHCEYYDGHPVMVYSNLDHKSDQRTN